MPGQVSHKNSLVVISLPTDPPNTLVKASYGWGVSWQGKEMALLLESDRERLTGLMAASQQVSFQTRPVEGTVGFGKVSTTKAAEKNVHPGAGLRDPRMGKGGHVKGWRGV